MKTTVIAIGMVLTGFFASTAQAGSFFIGGGLNNNSYNYDDVSNSNGNQAYLGYYFDAGVFVEAAAINLGRADIDFPAVELEIKGTATYIGYKWQSRQGFGWYAKGGMYSFTSEIDDLGFKDDSSGLALSGGFIYAFNNWAALRAGIDSYVGVEDFSTDETVVGGAVSFEARF